MYSVEMQTDAEPKCCECLEVLMIKPVNVVVTIVGFAKFAYVTYHREF